MKLTLFMFIVTSAYALLGAGVKTSTLTNFAQGKWDRSLWTPIRLPHQTAPVEFIQRKHSLGTDSFTKAQKAAKLDNVILIIDTGLNKGQFEVTFSFDSNHGTAPGFLLAPVIKNGVLQKGICIFVASYTMAVWLGELNPKTGKFEYKHLARLNRWSKPNTTHVFKCRYNKPSKLFIVQIDDAPPLMFRGIDCEINTKVGIWGCHGRCDYYSFKVTAKETLPGAAPKPKFKSNRVAPEG